jgi:hypothetical protein
MTGTLVERASSFLESRISRRSFINRSAYAGSAVAIGAGLDLVLNRAPPTDRSAPAAVAIAGAGRPVAPDSASSAARSTADTTTARPAPSWAAGGRRTTPPTAVVLATTWIATRRASATRDAGTVGVSVSPVATGPIADAARTDATTGSPSAIRAATASTAGAGPTDATRMSPVASSSATASATRTSTASVGSSAEWWRASRPGKSIPRARPPTPRMTAPLSRLPRVGRRRLRPHRHHLAPLPRPGVRSSAWRRVMTAPVTR